MSFFILCLLCIVQGLTEFLPISSSGHLLFFEQLFGIEGDILFLNLFLHLASLFAVIIFYRKIIFELIKKPFQPLTYKLTLSTILTCIFAVAYKVLNISSMVIYIYGFCFGITSIILFTCHKFQQNSIIIKKEQPSYFDSFIVGIVQGFAVLPGISRSGSTIATLIFLKNNEKKSAEYSFLLSIPIIIVGFLVELLELKNTNFILNKINILQYVFAFILTFMVAFIALKFTVKMLKNQKFIYFSTYLLIISIIVLIFNYI